MITWLQTTFTQLLIVFAREAEVIPNADAINPPKEFLTDWWSLFWDVYSARTGTARHPETLGASLSKTTQNVPTNVNPTIPSLDLCHMLHEDFNERNKGEKIPFQELPSTFSTTEAVLQRDFTPNLAVLTSGKLELSVSRNSTNSGNPILIDDSLNSKNLQTGKNVMEEEPLDVDSFFNDNPDDTSTLPHSSPAIEKNGKKGTAIGKNEQKGLSFEEVESFQTKTKLRCCHFSTSGKLLAAAGHDSKVLIWNLESRSTNIIKAHSNTISDIRFKPNSSVFATSSFDGNVQVWDAVKNLVLRFCSSSKAWWQEPHVGYKS